MERGWRSGLRWPFRARNCFPAEQVTALARDGGTKCNRSGHPAYCGNGAGLTYATKILTYVRLTRNATAGNIRITAVALNAVARSSPAQKSDTEIIDMLAIAWFWVSVLSLAGGVGVVSRGLFLIGKNGRLGLRFVSCGSAIVILGLVATFMQM